MTSSIFITKNIDILLMSLESLDLYLIDNLVTESNLLNITDLFIFRNNNILKYQYDLNNKELYYDIIIINEIIKKSSAKYLRKSIKSILKEISAQDIDPSDYSISTKMYINRFIIKYRQGIKPYLIGYHQYNNNSWLTKISIINLFILYKLAQSRTVYEGLIYLQYGNKHA